MRVNSSFPPPVQGVSTLAPRNRANGQAGLQENFRSDPVVKLTRRPPAKWEALLIPSIGSSVIKHHVYRRLNEDIRIILTDAGIVHGFVGTQEKTVTGNLTSYINDISKVSLHTVNDTTFVTDSSVITALSADVDTANVEKVSHINILTALDYENECTITIYDPSTGLSVDVTRSIGSPSAGSDAARATNKVAEYLAAEITAQLTLAVTAKAVGSTVAVWHDTADVWLEIKVSSGQGIEDVAIFNQVAKNADGLPLYAVHGTLLTVVSDKELKRGRYYVKAVGVNNTTGNASTKLLRELEEVIWEESRHPDQPHKFDETTMPHTILYNQATDDFTVGIPTAGWSERVVGDDVSAPVPRFIGNPIENISSMQARLLFLSDDSVYMSETLDLFNFWRKSAIQLFVTDPVSLSSSAAGIDGLKFAVNHNRDMLITSSNGQFKITGDVAVSPQTVSMALTTAFETQVTVPPVVIGNSVYLPISYGDSSGLTAYTGEANTTQDAAQPVTAHIVGYMAGYATILSSSSNLELIAMKTSGSLPNEFFVYEQARATNGILTQASWCKWVLPETTDIIDIDIKNDTINLICREGGNVILKTIRLYASIALNTAEIFLDDLLILDSNGSTAVLPTGYDITDCIVVRGENTDYPLHAVSFTVSGSTVSFKDVVSDTACKVYIGKPMVSRYIPTRPFRFEESGRPNTADRVRVNRFIVHVVETNSLKMRIISPYNTYDVQEFTSNQLGSLSATLGQLTFSTEDVKFSFSQDAAYADVEFFVDNHLGATIAGISWEGQVHTASRRI